MRKRICSVVFTVCLILLQMNCMIVPASARTDFKPAWPLHNGFNIISLDYYQTIPKNPKDGDGSHTGIDIGHGNKPTQDVYAVADGTVYKIGNKCNHYNAYKTDKNGKTTQKHSDVAKECGAKNLGNFVTIKHKVNGKVFYSQYGHLTQGSIPVKEGQKVNAGTKIGQMGSSGNSQGPHLHLVIYEGDWSSSKAQKTFDFYKDNPDVMKGVTIAQTLVKTSKNYGTWIKENGTLNTKTKRYAFTNLGTQTPPKPNAPSALAINLTNYPTSITAGDTFSLRGEVSSNYNITSVKGYIINSSNNSTVQTTSDTPNAKSMDIRPANLNQRMLFDKLPAGTYTLKIEAKDASGGNPAVEQKSFTVKAKGQENAPQDTPNKEESTLKINLTNYLSSITVGESASLRGTVSSNYNITSVKGYLINSSNQTVQSTTDTPNAKSMDIRSANLNQSMRFDKLSTGSYYLRIEATDATGKTAVTSKSITVNAKNSNSNANTSTPKMAYPNPGWYALTPACAPGMRLDVAYGGASSEDPVWIWEANSTPAQSWYLLPYSMTVGHYILISGTNMQTRMVLDVQYGGTESGTPVWLYESNDTPAQEWIFLDAGDGYYYVVPSENQSLALAVQGGSSAEGSSLVVETRNGSLGQKWKLIQ